MGKHEELTQKFSSWGDKLLQHTDVLKRMQVDRVISPITIQLAPVEMCDSDCPFCSVAARPIKNFMPWPALEKALTDFRALGAKSVEITGGGNPMLYRDKEYGKNINDIIKLAADLGMDVGIITNSNKLKPINPELYDSINWIRISLIKLDEGKAPETYDFAGFPKERLAFSYIIYDGSDAPDELSRTNRVYTGTTPETIEKIARLVELHQEVKFVRLAGNCLIKGKNTEVRSKFKAVVDAVDKWSKFFIKDIGDDEVPYDDACYVGLIRPYVASTPHGKGPYKVYICTSHVLNERNYNEDWALCDVDDILEAWTKANERYQKTGYPYEVQGNKGKSWCGTCQHCFYKHNNKLLHTVASELPDRNFP